MAREHGLGDRWLAGERLAGVHFAQGDAVAVHAGRHAGRVGRVLLLASGPPAPTYLVDLGDARPVRLRQDELAPAAASR